MTLREDDDWPEDLAAVMPLVHSELKRLARKHLGGAANSHTLAPTALVNELYLRLLAQRVGSWPNRAHFFAVAARLLRRILVDHARKRGAAKRGGDADRTELEDFMAAQLPAHENLLGLNRALDELWALDAEQTKLVEMYYFLGMTAEEIAELTGENPQRIYHELRMAKAFPRRSLG
jgi:RNA polymerase sigma factor (TIGR02999 family)